MGLCFSRSRKGKFTINENNNYYVVDAPHKKHGANIKEGMKLPVECGTKH